MSEDSEPSVANREIQKHLWQLACSKECPFAEDYSEVVLWTSYIGKIDFFGILNQISITAEKVILNRIKNRQKMWDFKSKSQIFHSIVFQTFSKGKSFFTRL